MNQTQIRRKSDTNQMHLFIFYLFCFSGIKTRFSVRPALLQSLQLLLRRFWQQCYRADSAFTGFRILEFGLVSWRRWENSICVKRQSNLIVFLCRSQTKWEWKCNRKRNGAATSKSLYNSTMKHVCGSGFNAQNSKKKKKDGLRTRESKYVWVNS